MRVTFLLDGEGILLSKEMLICNFLKRGPLGQRKCGQGTQLLSPPKETTRVLPAYSPVSHDNTASGFYFLCKNNARE